MNSKLELGDIARIAEVKKFVSSFRFVMLGGHCAIYVNVKLNLSILQR